MFPLSNPISLALFLFLHHSRSLLHISSCMKTVNILMFAHFPPFLPFLQTFFPSTLLSFLYFPFYLPTYFYPSFNSNYFPSSLLPIYLSNDIPTYPTCLPFILSTLTSFLPTNLRSPMCSFYLSTYRPAYFSTSTNLSIFLPAVPYLFLNICSRLPSYLPLFISYLLSWFLPSFFPTYLPSYLPPTCSPAHLRSLHWLPIQGATITMHIMGCPTFPGFLIDQKYRVDTKVSRPLSSRFGDWAVLQRIQKKK